jgi:threonine dehydratase
MLTTKQVIAAENRIRPYIRHTPLAPKPDLTDRLPGGLQLKLENLQVTGSFKVRGAFNNLLSAEPEHRKRGVVVASGGNHGLAIAYAAAKLSVPATVILPQNASEDRVKRIESWGATVLREGQNPSDSILAAEELASKKGLLYIHPFESEITWAGAGTVGLEIIRDLPEVDCALIAIGGGGLISGVGTVLKEYRPSIKIIGVEPCGAPKMSSAITGGGLVELLDVKTIADTLAPRVASLSTFEACKSLVSEIAIVSDTMLVEAMRFLWREYNQLAEPAGAAVIAAILEGIVDLSPYKNPIAIICGGNAAAQPVFEEYLKRANTTEPYPPGAVKVS